MSGGWTLKRFWKEASVASAEDGFAVLLDGRPVLTPGKRRLIVPTRGIAAAIAAEWQAQEGVVNPAGMPVTRTANSAIDTLGLHRAAVVADLAGYGGSDLLCYRAEAPPELVARQTAGWDPLLEWTAARFGAVLRTGPGVVPVDQSPDAVARLAAEVARQDNFRLAAFHDLVVLSGSLVIALAVVEGVRSADEAWALSRIDEDWQAEQWGEDDEAAEAARAKHAAFVHAAWFHALCGQADRGQVMPEKGV